MAFEDLQNKITALDSIDFAQELFNIVDANTDTLAEMQKEQMATGLDALGNPVLATQGAFYQPSTIKRKLAIGVGLGAETNVVTNYMTGNFYNTLKKTAYPINGGTIESVSDVPYFEDVLNRSGEVALDLNEDNRREFAETFVIPTIQNIISERVFS